VLVQTKGAEQMKVSGTQTRIKLSAGAQRANLTSQGLLKILKRTDSAIRNDGRWYADPAKIDQIAAARQALGLNRNTGATTKETS
jgi:hypothetical protein